MTSATYPVSFHTDAAKILAKEFRENRLSWTEYAGQTASIMIQMSNQTNSFPIVFALTEPFESFKRYVERWAQTRGVQLTVLWKDERHGAFPTSFTGGESTVLSQENLGSVLRLIKQRFGADKILVEVDDAPRLRGPEATSLAAKDGGRRSSELKFDMPKHGGKRRSSATNAELRGADSSRNLTIEEKEEWHTRLCRAGSWEEDELREIMETGPTNSPELF
ncbi:hypothetical protein MMC28_005517 [Mycoblastus sanguinarius]|nr:hypothetical protein [Mycoblastus sanguinarius]